MAVSRRPRALFDKVGDQPDRQEADKEGGELAAEVGNDGAPAARQGCNPEPRHVLSRLHAAASDRAGTRNAEELALRGPWAERRDPDSEAGHLGSQPQREKAVEGLGGRVS